MAVSSLKGFFLSFSLAKTLSFNQFYFHVVTLLLALITLSLANPIIRPKAECSECQDGLPDVPVDFTVTPSPSDDCADGIIDVSRPLPPVTPAPPPPC